MLNIGVRAHDFGKLSVSDLSDRISKYGFNSIQLALKKAIDGIDDVNGILSPGMGNYIRDKFYKNGINISVLGCYINPVHPNMDIRKRHLDSFVEHIRFASSFGCSIVGTETGSTLPNCGFTQDIYKESTFIDFIESLKVLVEAGEKFGVTVAIEGVADKHTIFSHERMMRVLELIPSPNLGIIYDPVNFLPNDKLDKSDELMIEAFQLFSHKMVAIHAKDYVIKNGVKDGTIPSGKGRLNYELLFSLINKHKPYIHTLLENNGPDTIEDSFNFIKKLGVRL
ncbi:sugar phosphate isomerase/epimerase [Thiospirochaeta perfilievii]|uniref:Sugar phosphate isomerase/epimerase n=1 Tax=Thiospirochaeta perfilievii TaxID=252967 RepID=A0A5C1QA19_9SPIO|nr:sugar phosphate isomerase/epimerase family protein [Thiospirochaeta perfilievii]QEN04317.1 sugar phosphate isomerase/epimerase [Thiospirochaeta perfilievii]